MLFLGVILKGCLSADVLDHKIILKYLSLVVQFFRLLLNTEKDLLVSLMEKQYRHAATRGMTLWKKNNTNLHQLKNNLLGLYVLTYSSWRFVSLSANRACGEISLFLKA